MLGPDEQFNLLWLEDSKDDVLLFSHELKQEGMNAKIHHVETGDEFREAIASGTWDVILADYALPCFSPGEALELINSKRLDIPMIIVSGAVKAEDAIALMRAGARDFVKKDDISRLLPAIVREMADHSSRKEKREARAELNVRNSQLADTLDTLRAAQEDALRSQRIRAVSEMASGVAHDFNNNLMKLSGLFSLISSRVGEGDLIDNHSETIQEISSTLDEGKRVMRRIAHFYANNPNLKADKVDLISVVEEVIKQAKQDWEKYGIHKSVKLIWNGGEPAKVLTRETDLHSALMNLIINAAEAMLEGGEIKITVDPSLDHRYLLKVTDSGIGMSKNELRRCLEPFFSTKGEFGTGLGLGIADAVIRQYGGTLSVSSEKDKGTTASILLRAAGQEITNKGSEKRPGPPVNESRARILLTEDDTVIANLLKRFLEIEGHQVDIANSGAEALDLFDAGKHAMVVSDRSMPGMTGDELAIAVKELSPEMPFLMVTGFGDIMLAKGEQPEGVDRILAKPIDQKTLAKAVSNLLSPASLES